MFGGRQLATAAGGIEALDEERLATKGITYIDVVAAADVVVSKPGYGIIADCLATKTRLVYLARPTFPEVALLTPAMQGLLGAVELPERRMNATGFVAAIEKALAKPAPAPGCSLQGVEQGRRLLASLL